MRIQILIRQAQDDDLEKESNVSMAATTRQDDDMILRRSEMDSKAKKRKRSCSTCSFPTTLYELLEDAEVQGYASIISWLPSGSAFQIHNPKRFCDDTMTKFFRQTKLDSFTRQLYIYGFSKETRHKPSSKQSLMFFHPEFLRGDVQACTTIARNQSGDRRLKKKTNSTPRIVGMEHPTMIQMQQPALSLQKGKTRLEPQHQRQLKVQAAITLEDAQVQGILPAETLGNVLRVANEDSILYKLPLLPTRDSSWSELLGWDLEPRTIEDMVADNRS